MIRGSGPPTARPTGGREDAPIEPLTVRIPIAVRLTGISRSRIYELIQSGDLPIKKIGRTTLIPFVDLKRFVGVE